MEKVTAPAATVVPQVVAFVGEVRREGAGETTVPKV
jgi:hypothetical protein